MQNTNDQNSKLKNQPAKQYDLEDRTLRFAKRVIGYVDSLAKTMAHQEITHQLIRSVGSVGANYIEANESLSKKDFVMRIKISRKEAKETRYWLELSEPRNELQEEKCALLKESTELMKILGAILEKCK